MRATLLHYLKNGEEIQQHIEVKHGVRHLKEVVKDYNKNMGYIAVVVVLETKREKK